jgi:thiamine-phosphate pyrophosphorylase
LPLQLPLIYPITNTEISGLSHAEQAVRLISGGATLIQLRDKTASSQKFYEAALESLEICHRHGIRVIINDRVDIAIAVGADGVHLGQDDMPPEEARRLLGSDAIIGFSTHSETQAQAAAELPIDYIGFGPIFGTATKQNADMVVGLEGLRTVRKIVPTIQIVAIGGITATNVASVLDAGADSAAVISGIVRDPDGISKTMAALLQAVRDC